MPPHVTALFVACCPANPLPLLLACRPVQRRAKLPAIFPHDICWQSGIGRIRSRIICENTALGPSGLLESGNGRAGLWGCAPTAVARRAARVPRGADLAQQPLRQSSLAELGAHAAAPSSSRTAIGTPLGAHAGIPLSRGEPQHPLRQLKLTVLRAVPEAKPPTPTMAIGSTSSSRNSTA